MHSTCQEKSLKRTKRDVERKIVEFGRKNSAGFVKTSVHRFMRTVWVGEYSETISTFNYNCTLSGKILAFVKNDLTELWRLPFICPLEKFGDKDFEWNFFQASNKKFSV